MESTRQQREALVQRALALKWTVNEICIALCYSGGGNATLQKFKDITSRNIEERYQSLLAAVVRAGRSSASTSALHQNFAELTVEPQRGNFPSMTATRRLPAAALTKASRGTNPVSTPIAALRTT
ncbi:Hypothetical protein, putative [Bodo saltans]|uniref:Uncharacterized protein n=1 Tax=Bodo saltans TaxID=75058 RepID=A0A0S4J505_BODSA|nr:Hypothetical protein, putative [Bodo saltans]|eukprot:CUG80230.1 Hypothetical protein, putative [Bodo saltans]